MPAKGREDAEWPELILGPAVGAQSGQAEAVQWTRQGVNTEHLVRWSLDLPTTDPTYPLTCSNHLRSLRRASVLNFPKTGNPKT
jgi:hypothetical protein